MSGILLVNSNRFKQPWPVIPHGICCVAAACEEAGLETRVVDLCFSQDCAGDLHRAIDACHPDVIGIGIRNLDYGVGSSEVFLLDEVRELAIAPIKSAFTGPIVIGGAAVGINAAEMLHFFGLEYAARGDGEVVMVEFLKRIRAGLGVEGLEGLVVRKGDEIVQNSPPCRVQDLDSLPLPNPQKYIDLAPYRKFDSPLQIQTKRGCSLKCCYCTYNTIEGRHFRLRSPQVIAEHVERLVKDTGIRRIEFADSMFNVPLTHAKAVLRAVIERQLKVRLSTRLNPRDVDDELADLLQRAGVVEVDVSAESGCDVTLKTLGKDYSKETVIRSGAVLRKRGIPISWSFLLGAPGETRATVEETFDTIDRAVGKSELVFISVGIRAYHGAPIALQMRQSDQDCTKDNFLHPVDYEPEHISLDEIEALTKRKWFTRANYFIPHDAERPSLGLQRIASAILRLCGSKQPVWRLLILSRRLGILAGLGPLRRWLWDRKLSRGSSGNGDS